jgi:2-polyprenyl-3-methyl-5-hydroxy-6-metoxy-1,4-benzoquinol methylase
MEERVLSGKTTETYWSKLYDNGRDFSLISSGELSKIITYLDIKALRTRLDIGCSGTGQLTGELYHRGYRCLGMDMPRRAL